MLGQVLPVLWEEAGPDGGSGLTDNYLRVRTRHPVRYNTITPARLTGFDATALWAEPLR